MKIKPQSMISNDVFSGVKKSELAVSILLKIFTHIKQEFIARYN